jgi:hypothetical protein
MKLKNIIVGIAAMLCITAHAQTTLSAWTFDNLPIGINSNPSPSTGQGVASALGMGNTYNNTNSISNPDIQSLAGSSSGGPNSWRIRGYSSANGYHGNGWSTNAPIGTQGVQFFGSTLGYYKIKIYFDVYATTDAEANLQVQYTTTAGTNTTTFTNWYNANITSAGTNGGVLATNTDPTQGTVLGTYVKLASGWNNQITVDLSGISGVDNTTNFAIRLVNASTGTNCVNTTGSIYNNTSGNWTFDNVVIQGQTIDTIADWCFDSTTAYPQNVVYNNPAPSIGSGTSALLGMNNTYNNTTSLASGDITGTAGASTGNGSSAWRLRGGGGTYATIGSPNGWSTQAPIGTQGAEFDVSTVSYTNIVVSFDIYFTTQAPAKFCVLYTTDGWVTTNVVQNLAYGYKPSFIQTNTTSPNTVNGTYFVQNTGQGFYNNVIADFTGNTNVNNNPNFAFRIVNAAKGTDDTNYLGQIYNNSSGNWRIDNISCGGTAGTPPPALNYDPTATVDHPFTNTFIDSPAWRAAISTIYVNGSVLPSAAYTISSGVLIFFPANSVLLQSSGIKNIAVIAPGFGTARVSQPLSAGVATQLAMISQAAGPSASGGTLTVNPVLAITDQYGNGTTNPYANVTVTATANSPSWILGGATVQSSVNGFVNFTNLTATATNGTGTVSNYITFTIAGYPPLAITNSPYFNIGAAPVPFTPGNLAVLQLDTTANNTTFSIIEINPSTVNQTNPVNIVPISATGANALREAQSGSCGKLALSDDGTLVCFAAFSDGSAATPDETLNLNRAGAGLNYTNGLVIGLNYESVSLGGSQARSCATMNNQWFVDDKGGLYQGNTNGGTLYDPNLNIYNNVVVRTFGGNPYVETQKAVNGQTIPVVYELTYDPYSGLYDGTVANNLTTDGNAGDFYLISTNGGTSYDILYILDQNSSTQGVIKKYSWVAGADVNNPNGEYGWLADGTYTNGNGGDSLFATPNGNGGAYLYMTTGTSSSNQVVQVTDAAGWNATMNVTSTNVIYSASGNTYVKGITFVPQQTPYSALLIPPPILTAQNGATVTSPFSVTNTPDVPAWRTTITGITVNGSPLPAAAYSTNQAGVIVFYPAQSTLLQGTGSKTIVIRATGFGADSVVQTLTPVSSPQITGSAVQSGKFTFSFTSGSGLSFSVLATNNIAAPLASWPVVGTAVENPLGSGIYYYTNSSPSTNSPEFYRIRQP